MAEFSIFWPWYLKILYFSPPYHFQWFSGPFQPFFWKNGKKSEFGRFWPIFRKMALDMPKWPSETPRIGQMASFRMFLYLVTYCRIFGKVYREPSNFCRHALLMKFPLQILQGYFPITILNRYVYQIKKININNKMRNEPTLDFVNYKQSIRSRPHMISVFDLPTYSILLFPNLELLHT